MPLVVVTAVFGAEDCIRVMQPGASRAPARLSHTAPEAVNTTTKKLLTRYETT